MSELIAGDIIDTTQVSHNFYLNKWISGRYIFFTYGGVRKEAETCTEKLNHSQQLTDLSKSTEVRVKTMED